MKVGNIIKPTKESGFTLRSGAGYYDKAVVISEEPFIITSEQSDMKWEATIKKEYFEVVETPEEPYGSQQHRNHGKLLDKHGAAELAGK